MTDRAKEARPARAGLYGKRDTPVKAMVDADTAALLKAKARALGYEYFAEFIADVLTANARGVDVVAKVHADRLERAVTIGPALEQSEGDA